MNITITERHEKNAVIRIPQCGTNELFDEFYESIANAITDYALSDSFPEFAKYRCDCNVVEADGYQTVTLKMSLKVRGKTVGKKIFQNKWSDGILYTQKQKKKKPRPEKNNNYLW